MYMCVYIHTYTQTQDMQAASEVLWSGMYTYIHTYTRTGHASCNWVSPIRYVGDESARTSNRICSTWTDRQTPGWLHRGACMHTFVYLCIYACMRQRWYADGTHRQTHPRMCMIVCTRDICVYDIVVCSTETAGWMSRRACMYVCVHVCTLDVCVLYDMVFM